MFNSIISPEKVKKTFVFQKEDTQQSTIIDYQIDLMHEKINLDPFLSHHCPLTSNRVSIYDPSTCKFASLVRLRAQNGLVPRYLFEPAIILIRYIEKGSLIIDSQSYNSQGQLEDKSGDQRQGRSKERTIGEVIEVVKKWRDLHLHGHTVLRRRLNLQDAAKLVGISKKSLDDYYCQLRLGELYHFDYVSNFHEKMGALRTYVKNYRPEKQHARRRQNDKHPKNLKILNYYDIATHSLKNIEELMKQQQYLIKSSSEEVAPEQPIKVQIPPSKVDVSALLQPLPGFSQEGPASKQLFNLEHQFFKGFEIALDEDGDPYYELEKDMRKQDMEYDSNSFMFLD